MIGQHFLDGDATSIGQQIGAVLSPFQSMGLFVHARTFQVPHPVVKVAGLGRISLPLVPQQAQALLNKEGQGEVSVSKAFTASIESSFKANARAMNLDTSKLGLKLVLSRLVVETAESGHRSYPAKDTAPDTSLNVATFSVICPSDFSGGSVVFSHSDSQTTCEFKLSRPIFENNVPKSPTKDDPIVIDDNEENATTTTLTAEPDDDTFFSILHFNNIIVKPLSITSGQRLSLIYEVHQTNVSIPRAFAPCSTTASEILDQLVDTWRTAFSQNRPCPSKLLIKMNATYETRDDDDMDPESFPDSERIDPLLMGMLQNVGEDWNVDDDVSLAKLDVRMLTIEKHERGTVSFENPNPPRDSYGWGYGCFEESDDDDEEECICNESGICYYCYDIGNGADSDAGEQWLDNVKFDCPGEVTYKMKWVSDNGPTDEYQHVSVDLEQEFIGLRDPYMPSKFTKIDDLFYREMEPHDRVCVDEYEFDRTVDLIYRVSFLVFWPKEMAVSVAGIGQSVEKISEILLEKSPTSELLASKELDKLIATIKETPALVATSPSTSLNVCKLLTYCSSLKRLDHIITILTHFSYPSDVLLDFPRNLWVSLHSLGCSRDQFTVYVNSIRLLPGGKMLALVRLAEADLVSHVEILLSHIARNVNFLDTTGKDEHLVAFAYSTALKYNCLDLVESVRSKALSLSWLHLNAIWSELSRDRLSALNTDEYKWILRTILAKPFQSAAVVESLHRFLVEKELENDLKLLETALIRAGPKLALEMICKLFPSRRPPSTKPLNATAHVKRVIEGLNKSEMAQMDSNVIHDTLITLMSGMRGLDIGISKILTEAILAKPFPASDSKHMILQIHPMIVECRWDDLMATIESRLATVNPSVVLESLSLLVSRESLMSRINTWKGHLLRVLNGIKKETLATVDSEYLFTTAQGFLKVDSQVVKELINVIVRKPHLPPKESTFMALHRFIIERGWDDAMKNLEARIASYDIRVVMKSLNAVMEVPSLLDTLESWKVHILRLASGFRREEIVKLGEAELISAVKLFMKCQFVELARSFVRALVVLPTTSVGYEIHVMVLEKTWLDEMRCVELRMREEKSVALSVRLMELFKHPMFHTSLQFRAHCERVMDMFVQKDWSGFNATPESGKEFAKFYVTLLRFAFMDSLERVGAKAGELSLTNLVLVVYDSLKFLSKLIKLQEAHAEGGELSAKDEMAVKNSVQLQGVVHQLTLSLLSRKPSNAKDYLQVIPCLELVCSKISFMDLEQPLTLRKAFIKTTFELDATPTHNTQPGDFLQKLISHIHTHSPILKRELTTAPLRTLVQKRFTQVETFLQTTPSTSPTSWAQPHANLSLCKIDWKDQILTFLKGNLSEYRVRAQFGSLQAANEYSDQFNKFVARREFGVYASARASMMGGAGTAGVVINKDKSYQDAMHKKYIQLGSERGILVELLGIKNKV